MPGSTFVLRAARLDAREALESLIDAVWRTRPGPPVTVELVRDADEGRTFTRAADIDANFVVLTRRLLELRPDIGVIIAPQEPGPPAVRMWTNREFYDFVEALPRTERSLETYLRALAPLLAAHRREPGLALEVFADLLRTALTSAPAAEVPDAHNEGERLLWQQISELPRLKGKGDYAVVRGSQTRWYNTSVLSYLTAGASGAWHGFQAEGEDVEWMPFRTWHELRDFFREGQWYE